MRLRRVRDLGEWDNQRAYIRDDGAYVVITDLSTSYEVEITTGIHDRTSLQYRNTRRSARKVARNSRRTKVRKQPPFTAAEVLWALVIGGTGCMLLLAIWFL